ncbi:HSP20-like chaperone [Parachaetomium inaequale]|uniref:HSP20-like chaperone n=1 Tax=Parachaetomium inaequale TaxID=2588326 RepID=A0AAN6PJ87_9PEZI|nr:HSP20-like chaperone [Parachaetomium inaequale]
MMSFFPASFSAPAADPSFIPLFRLLDGFDNYSREKQATPAATAAPACRRQRVRQFRPQPATFNPRFDVRETETAYELHGELPGLDRENVSIEFPEPQTIVISGRIERNYVSESNNNNNNATDDDDSASTTTTEPEKSRRNSYQATVEDDPEDDQSSAASTPTSSPWTEVAKPVARAESQEVTPAPAQTQDQSKYWRRERSVGQFSRTFIFPARVDEDSVTAGLRNGILSITVPKAKAPVPRKIEIAV